MKQKAYLWSMLYGLDYLKHYHAGITSYIEKIKNIYLKDTNQQELDIILKQAKKYLSVPFTTAQPAENVFCYLKPKTNATTYLPIEILSIEKDSHICQNQKPDEQEITKHIQAFVDELEKISTDTELIPFATTLLYIYKKYLTCLSINEKYPFVNAFEDIKILSAFAHTIAEQGQIQNGSVVYGQKYPFVLLCIDISGIQSYIYNILSKLAAKSLKGRSFYLILLTDTIIQRIHKELGTTQSHIIYSGGGKGYLLLPHTNNFSELIEHIEKRIVKQILYEHYGDLYVNIGYIPFSFDENNEIIFEYQNETKKGLKELWNSVIHVTGKKKYTKFKFLLSEKYSDLFEPSGAGGKAECCDITGKEAPKGSKLVLLDEKESEDENKVQYKVTRIVKRQVELAENLRSSKYLIQSYYKLSQIEDENRFQPLQQGVFYTFLTKEKEKIDNALVKIFNRTEDFLNSIKGNNLAYGFTFYGGNEICPPFTDLAKNENNAKGFTRLGILRMDVDNLGSIFNEGLGEEIRNFASLSTLSTRLDWFFSGYLNTIKEQVNKTYSSKNSLHILYSGGDDLFVIGRWDLIIELAGKIRKDFRDFVGREDISISGGIAIVDEKYPIAKAADEAGQAEEKAKKYNPQNLVKSPKNAVCLLDEPVSWNKEFDFVTEYWDKLVEYLKESVISKNFLQKLFEYRNLQKQGKLTWQYLAAYNIARNTNQKNTLALSELKTLIFLGDIKAKFTPERTLELLCIAARLADFTMRNEKSI
ncbi:MAG: type III-A CRISPR-associated protein Cas10/Csm1 [Bacteroidia bacterium]|nr:type III-A CRISPR-associated protein Cas10/Csm1 [Bacteroidia bacterium]